MKKLYAVTSGEYSDWNIIALFETEHKAKLYIAYIKEKEGYVNPDVTEFILEPEFDEILYCTIPEFQVNMLKDGTVTWIREIAPSTRMNFKPIIHFSDTWSRLENNDKTMIIKVQAETKGEAIKIAGEKRTQLIAANLWGKTLNENGNSIS